MTYKQAIKKILKKLGYDLIIHKFSDGNYEVIIPKKTRIDSLSKLRQSERLPIRPLIRISSQFCQEAVALALFELGKKLK